MLLLLVACVRESEDMCVFAHMRGGLLTVNLSVAMDGGDNLDIILQTIYFWFSDRFSH